MEIYTFEFQVFYGYRACTENTEQPVHTAGETVFNVKSSGWRL